MKVCEIYTYLDYHSWLDAAFKQKKVETPAFSHRYAAERLGLKSSGYLLYVMQGKRNLTETMAVDLAQLFKLTKSETDYFLQLLRYAHAKSSKEKQFQFQRLTTLRRRQIKNLEPEQYRYFEKWYYPVVREALALQPFTGDVTVLAAMIRPTISASDASEALHLLTEMNMVERDADGIYRKKDAVVSTGDVWQSAVIRSYQHTVIEGGAEALETVPKEKRDISNLTIAASAGTLDLIAQRIANLRAEILEIARNEPNPDRILQCNFLIYPVAEKEGGRHDS